MEPPTEPWSFLPDRNQRAVADESVLIHGFTAQIPSRVVVV